MPPLARVSVVIPARNARRYIGAAIASVYSQTLAVSELIIVDDGSTDGTLAEAWRVIRTLQADRHRRPRRHARQSHWIRATTVRLGQAGPAAARNAGINAATCDWIAFLDADDTWHPAKIRLQCEIASRWPAVRLVTCDRSVVEDGRPTIRAHLATLGNPHRRLSGALGDKLGWMLPMIGDDYYESGWAILPSTVMLHREVFSAVGLFDETLGAVEDWEYFLRILAKYPLAVVDRPLVTYRLHATNTHRNRSLMEAGTRRYVELVMATPSRYPAGALSAAIRWQSGYSFREPAANTKAP